MFCLFVSTCVLQSVCVRTMDFVSAHKQIIKKNNTLNAGAHLQLEVCKSSQDLFKHPTNKNHHNYLQNHIKSIKHFP